jgi:hypothetical protein
MTDVTTSTPAAGLSAKQREKISFIWSVKETLRDHYKRHQYQDVILPFCVLRRLDRRTGPGSGARSPHRQSLLFAGANPVAFFDDGHAPYGGTMWRGHPVGDREPALELLRQLRDRQRRSEPMSISRPGPTSDGFCWGDLLFIGRRSDGRCAGNSKFTDFAVGSDSTKEANDPDNYNNPFLNANIAAAESEAMRYFQACAGGAFWSAATGAFAAGPAAPVGALVGGSVSCGQNLAGQGLVDMGVPEEQVRLVLTFLDWFGYGKDITKGVLRRLPR